MKTINMLADMIQRAISACNRVINGIDHGAGMFEDAMENARSTQLAEMSKAAESA
jgi:hypothetical protein